MRRRQFIGLIGGAMAWPVAARAQTLRNLPVIGFLGNGSLERVPDIISGIKEGLASHGFVEDRNFKFALRFAEYHPERVAALATNLLESHVDLIIMFAYPPAPLIATIAKDIPIVFFAGFDPVKVGLVKSLSSPGGNATGVSVLNVELQSKRLEVLHELIPSAKTVGYLGSTITATETGTFQAAASTLGLHVISFIADRTDEFEAAFAAFSKANVGAVFVGNDALFQRNSDRLAALAARHKHPTIYASRVSVLAGGLISYGTHYPDAYRIIGTYAARILNGEKPFNLPVQQITKIELLINLRAAKNLDLTIPATLLARADEVIE